MQSENVISELNKSLTSDPDDENFKDFSNRIQTYIDGQKWIKKPLRLSPSICARYGWKCIKANLLECVACGAKLSAPDSKIGNFESYKTCLEKTLSNLKESHGKYCPWPITPAPEAFIKMFLMPKEEALSQFLKRVQSSISFQNSFPQIQESAVTEMDLNEKQILSLCKMAGVKAEDAGQYGQSIVSLAAAGWIIFQEEDSKKLSLKCNNCLRSVWCGWFNCIKSENCQVEKDETSNAENNDENGVSEIINTDEKAIEEPPLKKKKLSSSMKKGQAFDPLYEHRPWCLWIQDGLDSYSSEAHDKESKENSTEASKVPGWKIFIKSLLKNICDFQVLEVNDTPTKEHIRSVRNLLEQWTNAV